MQVAVAHEERACGKGADVWQDRLAPWLAAAGAGSGFALTCGDGGGAAALVSPAAAGDAAVAAAAKRGYWGHPAAQRLAATLALCRDALDCWQLRCSHSCLLAETGGVQTA